MSKQDEHDPYISIFTPSQTDVKDLEAIFVQREALLTDAIERIAESATTQNKHHQLMVGSRGSGKTHLATLLVHRLKQIKPLNKTLRIAWLNEDETFSSLLDILLKIFSSLQKRYPKEYSAKDIECVYDMKPKEAQKFLGELLAGKLKNSKQTCLVIIENLDAMFEAIGKQGQEQLRAYIQENSYFTFFVTAQKLTKDLKDRKKPFFGFFQTEYLEALTEVEASELISNIAKLHHKKDVSDFLKTRQGKMRIKALHHLSGGNHRMYIVLSQFISRDSIDALVKPFLKMVDELTPYYQERVRWLPPSQRKIIELLSATRGTVSVKRMARQLFSTNQTISSQLKDLKEKGYVKSHKRGRESLYEITEPLMRICVEVKENHDNRPIAILVDFIRAWYDSRVLKNKLTGKGISKISQLYLIAALKKEDIFNVDQTKSLLDNIIKDKNSTAGEKLNAHLSIAILFYEKNQYKEAIAELTSVLTHLNLDVGIQVKTLLIRGDIYIQQREFEKALADYSHVIALTETPKDKADALFSRGVIYIQQGSFEKALTDFNNLIDWSKSSVEHQLMALTFRGVIYKDQGEFALALSDFSNVIERLRISQIKKEGLLLIIVHSHSVEAYIKQNKWKQAIDSLLKGLMVDAETKGAELYNVQYNIHALFKLNMDTELRISRVSELIECYKTNEKVFLFLGVGLIQHLGLLKKQENKPLSDNLNTWLNAWKLALTDIDETEVTLRLLTVGIKYLQSKDENKEILLDLIESERVILEQAFDL